MANEKKRVSAMTLGCKVNQYDTNAMLELLQNAGWEVVPWGGKAEVCLVNSCTVTNTADKKTRAMIRRAVQTGAAVVVCGCMAQSVSNEVFALGAAAAVGTEDRANIVRIAEQAVSGNRTNAVRQMAADEPFEELRVSTGGARTRGTIKIQEGCENFCSYCIIPRVRGRVRWRDEASVISEARTLAQSGVKEIVLTGIHISSYGGEGAAGLPGLLRGLGGIEGVRRIRLGSLEPQVLTEGFVKELSGIPAVCPHFHVPLQSGSAAVLRRMNRRYLPNEFAGYLDTLRRFYDRPAVTTDVIVGFPGETEEEYFETSEFVKQMGFARLHVFPYSEREGTPAAKMTGSVPVAVRKERARQLIDTGKESEAAFIQSFLGTAQDVLFEREGEGYTGRYLRVCVPGAPEGLLTSVLLERSEGDLIVGTII